MRSSGLVLSFVLCAATAAAQPPATLIITPGPAARPDLGPRTLTPAMVACTDLPTATPPASALRIVAAHEGTNKQAYSTGDIVVLNGGTPQGLMAGQRFLARRLQMGFSGEGPSIDARGAVRTAGWLTVVAADEHSALARIEFACDSVMAGDFLDAYVEPTLPQSVTSDGPADFSNLGRVLFGADRRQSFGDGDVVNIDRGSAQGVTTGTRVAFYRDRRNGTPLVEMGAGVVVDVAGETAKVVITRARDEVRMGDYFAVRGAAAP